MPKILVNPPFTHCQQIRDSQLQNVPVEKTSLNLTNTGVFKHSAFVKYTSPAAACTQFW